jgi:hypothetical protein
MLIKIKLFFKKRQKITTAGKDVEKRECLNFVGEDVN